MTTFSSAYYIVAHPNRFIEDGQVASTSNSQKLFGKHFSASKCNCSMTVVCKNGQLL